MINMFEVTRRRGNNGKIEVIQCTYTFQDHGYFEEIWSTVTPNENGSRHCQNGYGLQEQCRFRVQDVSILRGSFRN